MAYWICPSTRRLARCPAFNLLPSFAVYLDSPRKLSKFLDKDNFGCKLDSLGPCQRVHPSVYNQNKAAVVFMPKLNGSMAEHCSVTATSTQEEVALDSRTALQRRGLMSAHFWELLKFRALSGPTSGSPFGLLGENQKWQDTQQKQAQDSNRRSNVCVFNPFAQFLLMG